ncbi:glycosyltransferase [Marinococcus halotolerans]|uniref:glycosyltransferase n=1 Tax=Marinococcus halotolerans TaxID=301092 RepID=UPI0003B5AC65|nr:glycosyltransferase [Marinococcus halotolerans]
MKVLHINTSLDSGGAAKSVKQLSEKLNEFGVTSDILIGFQEDSGEKFFLYKRFMKNINVLITRFTGLDSVWYPFSKKNKLKKIIAQYDLIHIHNFHGYFMKMDYLNLFKDKPVIWSVRDFWIITGGCAFFLDCERWKIGCGNCPHLERYPKSSFFDFTNFMFRKKEMSIGELNNITFVTLTDWVKDTLEKSHLKNSNIYTINNGFDPTIYNTNSKKSTNSNYKILLMANVLKAERKGIKPLLESLQEIPNNEDYEIHIVGEGLSNELRTIINNYKVIEYGYVKDPVQLSEIYASVDLFVNLSSAETFGRTSVESMLCGTRVLAYDIPVMKEVLGDFGVYINVNSNAKDIAKKIENFMRDYNKDPMTVRNFAMKYSIDNSVSKHIDLYKKTLLNKGD